MTTRKTVKAKPLMAWGVYSPTLDILDKGMLPSLDLVEARGDAQLNNRLEWRNVKDWRPVRVKIEVVK